jgi:hypothetical protein
MDEASIDALKARIESPGFEIEEYMELSELSDSFFEEFISIMEKDLKHTRLPQPDNDLGAMLQRYHHS